MAGVAASAATSKVAAIRPVLMASPVESLVLTKGMSSAASISPWPTRRLQQAGRHARRRSPDHGNSTELQDLRGNQEAAAGLRRQTFMS